ncbi:carboxylesterase/lipase family protein, partial [Streptomyces sp. UH6]|uniref:carboxylesterase/lipase family protein n=1 Tax=Streptomyces sp. UH6 TaxID=2748379 RepID=UPI0015D4F457
PQVPSAYTGTASTEEDCLVLDVTTPPDRPGPHRADRPESHGTARPGARGADRHGAPVLVWIHGDGSVGGGSLFDGRRLAARGLVVVTVNYRLGVFGGLALPGVEGSGTFGLLDQQAALRWVRRNAAAFGGDPGNVTVAGVSFGASAISGHLTSPGARGLFHRAVMASGEGLMDMPAGAMGEGVPAYPWYVWRSRREVEEITAEMTAPLGCAEGGTDRVLECLRGLPVRRVLEVPQIMNAFQVFAYGTPALPELPPDALRAGRFLHVPVLSGATRDEHRLFAGLFHDAVGNPLTPDGYHRALRTAFGEDAAARVAARYPVSAFPSPSLAWAQVFTDRMWALGTHAQHRVLGRRVPLYAYEFADRDAPMFLPLPGGFDFGAFHAGDTPYLFEDEAAEPLFSPAQRRLSSTMAAYWATFARTGAPGGPGLPEWPRHRPDDRRPWTQSLAPDRIGPVDYRAEHRLAFWEELARHADQRR